MYTKDIEEGEGPGRKQGENQEDQEQEKTRTRVKTNRGWRGGGVGEGKKLEDFWIFCGSEFNTRFCPDSYLNWVS